MSESIILTPEIIAIMEQAGISEVEIKKMANTVSLTKVRAKVKKNKQTPAQEYILESTAQCKLCGTAAVTRFYMQRTEENPSVLESVKITKGVEVPSGLPTQERFKIWSTCSHCRDYLRELDKDTLVDMVMTQHTRREVWK